MLTLTSLAGQSCVAAGFSSCCTSGCSTGGCYCDRECYNVGDCCADIHQICSGIARNFSYIRDGACTCNYSEGRFMHCKVPPSPCILLPCMYNGCPLPFSETSYIIIIYHCADMQITMHVLKVNREDNDSS